MNRNPKRINYTCFFNYEVASAFMILVLFFLIMGITPLPAALSSSPQTQRSEETLIRVGKYNLNFRIIRGGDLTILLEAGGGMDSTAWTELASVLAIKTGATVVSYDRAGLGKSDLPETPYDMHEEIDWLWQALKHLDLDRNLLLIGHSWGGWLIRLTASQHPNAIKGMVFVDPFTNEIVDALGAEYIDNHPTAGKQTFDNIPPEKLTKFQRALVRRDADGLEAKAEVMRKTTIPPGIPVRIITCGKSFLPKPEEHQAWRQSHEQMTASIPGAKLLVAERSGHMIQWDQPEVIIEAVKEIIHLIEWSNIAGGLKF